MQHLATSISSLAFVGPIGASITCSTHCPHAAFLLPQPFIIWPDGIPTDATHTGLDALALAGSSKDCWQNILRERKSCTGGKLAYQLAQSTMEEKMKIPISAYHFHNTLPLPAQRVSKCPNTKVHWLINIVLSSPVICHHESLQLILDFTGSRLIIISLDTGFLCGGLCMCPSDVLTHSLTTNIKMKVLKEANVKVVVWREDTHQKEWEFSQKTSPTSAMDSAAGGLLEEDFNIIFWSTHEDTGVLCHIQCRVFLWMITATRCRQFHMFFVEEWLYQIDK